MGWTPYAGDHYPDFNEVEARCRAAAAAAPGWLTLETLGQTRQGRPLLLLTLGDQGGDPASRPAFWLDAGTHAVEWTGVSAALYSLGRWVEGLLGGDEALTRWFTQHTLYLMPCVSPDGLQASAEGAPYLRSTLRPPRPGTVRSGLEPRDMDGDGRVRWMRWRHPAGPWVTDGEHPLLMRPRTLRDDPEDAWFFCDEGELINWDGQRWTTAPRRYGLDLNRNFPVDWRPFSMFGMDAGAFPGSAPESRALLEAVRARPNIAAGLTNHTYTGCILAPPGSKDSPLPKADIGLMQKLAADAVAGTGYRVFKVYPEFMYDPDKPIIGTWDDSLQSVFGVAAYTLELWDPYRWAGVDNDKPVEMFRDPKPELIRPIVDKAVSEGAWTPWRAFDHPQLGPVEIGGLEYMRTVRNPPDSLLAEECERGFMVADRLRRALPRVEGCLEVEALSDELRRVSLSLENLGAMSSSGLRRAADVGASPAVRASIELPEGAELIEGPVERELGHLDGWMTHLHGFGRNPIYPDLPSRGHRARVSWLVKGEGRVRVRWVGGGVGRG